MNAVYYPNIEEFNTLIQNKKVLVDFYAEWCGPCKLQSPIIEKLANENDEIIIIKVDIDQYPSLASLYNIHSIPTLIIFSLGKEINRQKGFVTYHQLRLMIR